MTKCRIGEYIKDVASGPFGSNLKVECFVPTGFPIIDGANLTGLRVSDNITKFVTEEKARSLSRSIAKRRDVIVTISGTLGQVSYIPDDSKYEEYLCSQRQFRVTFDESKINVEYIVNLLRTPYGQRKILAFANYVGVPALAQPIPNFKNIELYLPDLPTQLRIAGVMRKRVWTTHHSHYLSTNSNLERCLSISLSSFAPCALRSARRDLNPEIFSANSSAVIGTYSIFTSKYCPAESV